MKNAIIIAGPFIGGLLVFLILHSLLIEERISIPAAFLVSILTFGLVRYYSSPLTAIKNRKCDVGLDRVSQIDSSHIMPVALMFFFVLLYVCSLVIVTIAPHTRALFMPWEQVSPLGVLQFGAALMVTTFAPGYVVILLLTPKMQVSGKFVLSVTTSIFLTGLVTYTGSSIGLDFSTVTNVLILIYFILWVVSTAFYLKIIKKLELETDLKYCRLLLPFSWLILRGLYNKWTKLIKHKSSEIVVFASLFGLIVISTYYLYGGVIIGDQWLHHAQALSFISNNFRFGAISNEILSYPQLLPAYLAGFFGLSGLPSVNSYAAISFLNILPVFAFYYFFSNWVPGYAKKAAILASAIFMLSAGFGWLYVLYLSFYDQISAESASLDLFNDARIKSFDIFQPSSFIGVDHPGITSPLIVIALPVGLATLGLIADPSTQRGLKLVLIISLMALAGILSHPEFFIFIIVGSLAALIFDLTWKKSVLIAFIISIAVTLIIDMLPGHYYSASKVGGISIIYLTLVFVVSTLLLSYYKKVVEYISSKNLTLHLTRIPSKFYGARTRFLLSLVLISLFVYFYFLSFLIWGDLSLKTVQIQTLKDGQQIIPWYLYPIKLGVCAFIGPLFIIYCLFKKQDKRIFIFLIILIVALFAGPYYDEHRFSKYVMVGLVGFSALLISSIITRTLNSGSKVLRNPNIKGLCVSILIGLVIVSVSMSVILYTGYSALAIKDHYRPFERDLPKRNFPSTSEINMLQLIYDRGISTGGNYNVALPPTEYKIRQDGFAGKLEAFTGIPTLKILKGQRILEASSLQEFNNLLNVTNTKYIILPKDYIKNDLNITNIKQEAGSDQNGSFQPARFALENFDTFYEDKHYLVLSIPHTAATKNAFETVQKKEERDTESTDSPGELIKVPGDVSQAAKEKGIEIPWQQTVVSYKGIALITSILLISFFVGYRSLSSPGALKNHKS